MREVGSDELVHGDARRSWEVFDQRLKEDDKIAVTITSPPYWNLKNYGSDNQIGWKQGYEAYLAECGRVFQQIFDRTSEEGSMWVISDTMLNQRSNPKALVNLPFDLAGQAAAAGWTLREVYIWQKDRTIPYTSRGRLRNSFEYIHFYVKTERFHFFVDRLRDPINLARWWVQYPERYNPKGKAPTNVWTFPIPTQGAWSNGSVQHACPLPPDMVERMILLSSQPGEIVFDPFAGTGTVLSEARRLGRTPLGIELNETYVEQYLRQMRNAVMSREDEDSAAKAAKDAAALSSVIRRLRVVKFPKSLSRLYQRTYEEPLNAIALFVSSTEFSPVTKAAVTVVVPTHATTEQRSALQTQLQALVTKYPLSQFQVDSTIDVQRADEFVKGEDGKHTHYYQHGRTWTSAERGDRSGLLNLGKSSKTGKYLPIGSNIHLNVEAHRPYA